MLANSQICNRLEDFFLGTPPVSDSIRPASVDLSVGSIAVPPKDEDGELVEATNYIVGVGGTLIIETEETLSIPATHAGLMFPKSSALAEKGILITNFGCVDPGYVGKLKFVIVNLGRKPFGIRKGDKIVTLTLFLLAERAEPDYSAYRKGRSPSLSIRETSKLLSHDLVQVKERASLEAKRAISSSVIGLGMILSLFLIVPTIVLAVAPPFLERLYSTSSNEQRLDVLEAELGTTIPELQADVLKLQRLIEQDDE